MTRSEGHPQSSTGEEGEAAEKDDAAHRQVEAMVDADEADLLLSEADTDIDEDDMLDDDACLEAQQQQQQQQQQQEEEKEEGVTEHDPFYQPSVFCTPPLKASNTRQFSPLQKVVPLDSPHSPRSPLQPTIDTSRARHHVTGLSLDAHDITLASDATILSQSGRHASFTTRTRQQKRKEERQRASTMTNLHWPSASSSSSLLTSDSTTFRKRTLARVPKRPSLLHYLAHLVNNLAHLAFTIWWLAFQVGWHWVTQQEAFYRSHYWPEDTFCLFGVTQRFPSGSSSLDKRQLALERRAQAGLAMVLMERMRRAQFYPEWHKYASELDLILRTSEWKATKASIYYDHRLIEETLQQLREARQTENALRLLQSLRSGLLRNLGGVGDPRLYTISPLGTKTLIEAYHAEVIAQIRYLAHHPFTMHVSPAHSPTTHPALPLDPPNSADVPSISPGMSPGLLDPSDHHHPQLPFRAIPRPINKHTKWLFDIKQSFGHTALLFQGGSTLGMVHLGVAAALHQQHLLPRIVSGTSIGAIIAALICTKRENELESVFQGTGIDLRAFDARETLHQHWWSAWKRRIKRLIQYGYLFDMQVLKQCVRDNIDNVTFEEAYHRTGRILNIPLTITNDGRARHFVLNYLTSPNVVIWSAALASCAVTGLYDHVSLLAKTGDGRYVPYLQDAFSKASNTRHATTHTATATLAELFNVNHYIISQASVFVLPFLPTRQMEDGCFIKCWTLLAMELRHRATQLYSFGLLPAFLRPIVEEDISGSITISADIGPRDVDLLFSAPSGVLLSKSIMKGQQSTWRHLALLRNRLGIELALADESIRLREWARKTSHSPTRH